MPRIEERTKAADYIIATRDTHSQDYLNTFEGQRLPVMHCIYGTPGYELINELNGLTINTIVDKSSFGSFVLANAIQSFIDSYPDEDFVLELCGVCTDICVVSNAAILRSAYNLPIEIRADCCVGTTPEKHFAALETMRSIMIDVIE